MLSRIIFLDIDGVLNTVMVDTQPISQYSHLREDGFYYDLASPNQKRVSNRQAVMWLNLLCKQKKAKIVISSTWRLSLSLDEMKEALVNSGLLPEIEVIGATPNLGYLPERTRGLEIQRYLDEHYGDELPQFIILDDDSDMDHLLPHLIQCNVYRGFGMSEYLKAISYF